MNKCEPNELAARAYSLFAMVLLKNGKYKRAAELSERILAMVCSGGNQLFILEAIFNRAIFLYTWACYSNNISLLSDTLRQL